MADLGQGLKHWLADVEKQANLSVEDKAKITGAGAEAYKKVLYGYTPRSNLNEAKHLQDNITYKAGFTSDGYQTGDTTVGWSNSRSALVARFVNEGVHNMSPKQLANMHFKERAEEAAKGKVLEAEKLAYEGVISKK